MQFIHIAIFYDFRREFQVVYKYFRYFSDKSCIISLTVKPTFQNKRGVKKKLSQKIFKRHEKKYFIPEQTFPDLLKKLEEYMEIDSYGKHTICNLYFDTDDFQIIRTSIEKPIYKEKLRLRCYGIPSDDDTVFLEIKKKFKGVVYKRRVAIKCSEARLWCENGTIPKSLADDYTNHQIMKEIIFFRDRYGVSPKMYLAYDRIALFEKENPNFRLTFDSNIRSRENDLNLSHGDNGVPLLKSGGRIMEIKTTEAIPLWLSSILNDMKLFPTSFSKYGKTYENKFLAEKSATINDKSLQEINT